MSTTSIIMLVITLVIIWGGFIISLMRLPKE
ncbi:methionine/alanine import family NSS transporter small subunit [Neisseria sp.]|nr:methionine/alanine import family NSS transporter small subunit [Neisseria sp.]MDO4906204.1 methionine/alanine import family NSS transporter small subunit [Neisseria sp.]